MTDETQAQTAGMNPETQSTEPTTFFSRRRLMKGTAGAVGIAALGGLGFWYGTQPALAASTFEESPDGTVTVTTNAGEVMDVSVAPVFTLNWSDFGGGVSGFDFDLTATVGTATDTVYTETAVVDASSANISSFTSDDMSNYNGTVSISCALASIIDGANITTGSFPTNVAQGSSQSQTVTLTLTPSGTTNIGSTSVSAADATLSFDVIVENPDGTMTATIDSSNAQATGADSSDETNTTV